MPDRCPACPGKNNCLSLSGPGNRGGRLFIGEAPGFDENKRGIPFVGKTGKEVNEHYLPLAGLRRGDEDFTNAIKCMPDVPKGKLDIRKARDLNWLNSCSEHFLYDEICTLQPKLLIPMGNFACHAIDPTIDLDLHHGMPRETPWGTAFPMYHPAGGLHEPKRMLLIRNDWVRLRWYIRGYLLPPVDKYPNPIYREATQSDVRDIDPTKDIACDTESSSSQGPYCLTYSQEEGKGFLIRASSKKELEEFQKKMGRWESTIYFHNWLYDWTITENLGFRIPHKRVNDTMMMVYHLGNLPQGLKTLSFRLNGMVMQDFDDLVSEYSKQRIIDYYVNAALNFEWSTPEEELVYDEKTGKYKIYKPQGLKTKLKRLMTDVSRNDHKDLLGVWDNWEVHHEEIIAKLGPYVGLDIADVPFEKALYYACRDADATIRLVPKIMKMREIANSGKLQEYWEMEAVNG